MTESVRSDDAIDARCTCLIDTDAVSVAYARRGWLPGRSARGATPAVEDVTLAVYDGDHTALVGQSGCGKSTLARMMAGLLRPTRGRVRWSGADIGGLGRGALRRQRMAQVQYVWQDPYASLDPRCTVIETVTESVECHDAELDRDARGRAADALLEAVALQHVARSRVASLSGGERRRLTVARALAAKPAVLVVDEPTTGLDPVLTLGMARLLRRVCHAPGGPTLLLITHDLDVARYACARIVVMDRGRLIYEGGFDGLPETGAPAIDDLLHASTHTRLPADFDRAREAGVATLEYLVIMAVATLTLGLFFYLLSKPIRDYLDFALWWLGIPLH